TAAAEFAETVPSAVVAVRRERLRQLGEELTDAYLRTLVGRRLDVLVEGEEEGRPGFVRGTACRYAPVVFRGHAAALIRRRVPVRATAVIDGALLGEPEPDDGPAVTPRQRPQPRTRLPLPLLA